jgi:hypothetical protein
MDWIKRNLMFVIGSVVSLLLMVLAGWYLWTEMGKNAAALEKLNAEYAEMERLSRQNPHPGDDKVNNIEAAKLHEKSVRAFIGQATGAFQPIPPIPEGADTDNAMLADALRRTLASMRKEASTRGVQVASNFFFSFTAQRNLIQFDRAGVLPLARQLGEVKAICDVLFAARVNLIDGIRRGKVSPEDNAAQATTADYLERGFTTNDVGVAAHYEITVRCFSTEVGAMLGGFASSQNGLIVRAINVEPSALAGTTPATDPYGVGMTPGGPGVPGYNPYLHPGPRPPGDFIRPGFGPPPAGTSPPPGGTPTKSGLVTMLDEKQLKVTLLVDVVKLIPKNPKK